MQIRSLASATLLVFSLCCALPAQQRCSMQQVVGTWGFTLVGWDILNGQSTPAPETMIGIVSVDESGKVTGAATSVLGAPLGGIPAGQPLDSELVDASVQVNPDCTGFFKYSILLKGAGVPAYGPNVDRLVVLPFHNQVLAMRVHSPLSKPLEPYTMNRISFMPAPVSWPAVPTQ